MDAKAQSRMVKNDLHQCLQDARSGLLSKLDGLGEPSLRRPMTPTGTNLLGIMKHLGSEEYGYLGEVFDRPPQEPAPAGVVWLHDSVDWDDETSGNPDMWARPDESSDYILGFYRRACVHADETITSLDWDANGFVPWWDEKERRTTLGTVLIRMLAETLRTPGTSTSCANSSMAVPAPKTPISVPSSGGGSTSHRSKQPPTPSAIPPDFLGHRRPALRLSQ